MNKTLGIALSLLSAPVAADMLRIHGVKPLDVSEGSDFHSFTIDRPELYPSICPNERIVFSADLEMADIALGHILDIEEEGVRLKEIQYQIKADGQCHLWKFEKEDRKFEWDISHLFLQPHVWHVTGADRLTDTGRLVSLGCPTYYDGQNVLWWEYKTNQGQWEGRMTGRWGDWCDSGEYKFRIPGDGWAAWRIVNHKLDGTKPATDWVALVPTP